MRMPAGERDPRPADPLEELRGLPRAELERRARAHVQGLREEMSGLKDHVEKNLHPTVIARKHPLLIAGMGAALGYVLVRRLRGSRRSAAKTRAESDVPLSPKHAFRNSLLSGLAKAAGGALPAALLWGIKRHKGRSSRE